MSPSGSARTMLISPRMLVDRLRHPRSRADELARLRARFQAQPSAGEATDAQRALALRLRALRAELSEAVGHVEACRGCAKGHPLPSGRWDGGHCCGGNTLDIWSATEAFALKLGGTSATKLEAPRGDHAGCAFRGETGCSLAPVDRPSLCLRYVCMDLRAELRGRADWLQISRLAHELTTAMQAFEALVDGSA